MEWLALHLVSIGEQDALVRGFSDRFEVDRAVVRCG
jgi:hypothetical protein